MVRAFPHELLKHLLDKAHKEEITNPTHQTIELWPLKVAECKWEENEIESAVKSIALK